MESYLTTAHYDLVTPDGKITSIKVIDPKRRRATLEIEHISPAFVGYDIEPELVTFNLKSTLAQLGLNGSAKTLQLDRPRNKAYVEVDLVALSPLSLTILELLEEGAYVGKLFAADPRRRVRDPDYLERMFGRTDRHGRPLLSLGKGEGASDLHLEKIEGRTIAFLSLRDGAFVYEKNVYGFLPTLAKALIKNLSQTRLMLHLHQVWQPRVPRCVTPEEVLLVRTAPLHIRTVHARVVDSLLPSGFHHTSANILEPHTYGSGDIYELYGKSSHTINTIPLEFYTLEPHREHVFFPDRDQLIGALEDPQSLFTAFATAPPSHPASVFVVKGSQMKNLAHKDWISRDPIKHEFPGLAHPETQAAAAEKYIEDQPQYPFLRAMEDGRITSQGALFTRYFPSPLLKRLLLSDLVSLCLKRIYFQYPSRGHGSFFSHEDRALLVDLAKFGIPTYWVDETNQNILQYTFKPETESGMFVPLPSVEAFRKATVFGIYGSNLQEGNFESELKHLFTGLLHLRSEVNHPLLKLHTPLALVTGGGPGAMEVGNRVAKTVGILSCANIVDFRQKDQSVVNEQKQNPYIEAKMTYRLDRLVERQAEFYLDFPIFLPGGIGMDFEFTLEEVRRKTGGCPANPILLFGTPDYWKRKITSRFQLNRETGTIKGSEWVSNCFHCVQTGAQGLEIYRKFFQGKLPIGKGGPICDNGFCF